MLIFQRKIESKIKANLFKNRAILIFGPRQVGKTTLAKKIVDDYKETGGYFNCELASVRKHFALGKPDLLKELTGDKKIAVFDEAQTIENIGAILKVFVDSYPTIQIIATGSSSFDLANKIKEPLTGRSFEYTLLPLSVEEIKNVKNFDKKELLEIMRLGSYPAIVAEENKDRKVEILKNLATNYLYKDVFVFESIKNPTVFENLVKMLALQIGSLVSINEMSATLGTSRATVDKYIRLLEQAFVVKVVRSFSHNPRTEIKKAFKIYFLDAGIRNAVIDDISDLENRNDRGLIFENFFFSELLKTGSQEIFAPQIRFWRTRTGAEIDFITEKDAKINAYECKWSKENVSFVNFLKKYPAAKTETINPEKFLQILR